MCLTFFHIMCLAFIPEGTPRFSFIHLLLSIAGGWSWNYNTLATWCEELTHLKRPGCWERLKAREEGDNRGWDGWMASETRWTWVWINSGSWWWTGRPGVLQSVRSQSDMTERLNWSVYYLLHLHCLLFRIENRRVNRPKEVNIVIKALQQRPGKWAKASCSPGIGDMIQPFLSYKAVPLSSRE